MLIIIENTAKGLSLGNFQGESWIHGYEQDESHENLTTP